MPAIDELIVSLDADLKPLDKALKQATTEIRAFAAVADRELRGVAEQTTALSNVGQSGPGAAAQSMDPPTDPCVDPSMAPAGPRATAFRRCSPTASSWSTPRRRAGESCLGTNIEQSIAGSGNLWHAYTERICAMRNCLLSLLFVAGLLSPSVGRAELDETEMYWFKSRMNLCGRAYQIGSVAAVAKTKFGLPNLRRILLNLAENVGASEEQIEELGQDFDEGRDRSIQEGSWKVWDLTRQGRKSRSFFSP